jgi:hypothetical protein
MSITRAHLTAARCIMKNSALRAALRAVIVAGACGFAAGVMPVTPPAAAQAVLGVPVAQSGPTEPAASAEARVRELAGGRLAADLVALQQFRPGYPFWQHIFEIPDGSVAFGSRRDGRLLAVLPTAGDWTRTGRWIEPSLAPLVQGRPLPARPADRTEEVARRLEAAAGPIMHNGTRGRFLLPNAQRYGAFLAEWGAIYQRFGVPAEIGLAQAIIESGLNGTVRSEANAVGFCQWLRGNWNKLNRMSPHVIEAGNQTTQAPYCAAYLTILATKYDSFVPALSEHHAGGTNVGRTLIKGARLGGGNVRTQYFLGSDFALALRGLPNRTYTELYGTYGPRSHRYTELVFGNTATVVKLRESTPQQPIFAMRADRDIMIDEIVHRSGLHADEIRRYNPGLTRHVPATAAIYLPTAVPGLGRDVAFWHRPADDGFAAALADFMAIDATAEEWDRPGFERVLLQYQRRFEGTRSEEGTVMATVLAYVIDEMRTGRRGEILAEFRTSDRIARLFEQGTRAVTAPLGVPGAGR